MEIIRKELLVITIIRKIIITHIKPELGIFYSLLPTKLYSWQIC